MSTAARAKSRLISALGQRSAQYWHALNSFFSGQIVKAEFEECIQEIIVGNDLIELHNTLVLSLLEAGTFVTPPTPPPDGPKLTRKRKRLLPYQGPDAPPDEGEGSLRSKRLKHWSTSISRADRETLKQLHKLVLKADKDKDNSSDTKDQRSSGDAARGGPIKGRDMAMHERGIQLLREGKDPPGTHLPLHLSSTTRAQSLQHIAERLVLISSQNDLSSPPRQVASLLLSAFESKIKSLITHAITLTSSSHVISSIHPTNDSEGRAKVLNIDAFRTVLTLAPHELPTGSAAEVRVYSGLVDLEHRQDECEDERHVDDPRWQLLALLKERSGVKEALQN